MCDNNLQSYQGPFAVWGLIQSIVPQSEMPLIRSHIGESLVEYCSDLRIEVTIAYFG